MTDAQFRRLTSRLLLASKRVLQAKANEYATSSDRLHNFKRAALLEQCTPEKALRGMLVKHLVSIYDMIDGTEAGHQYPIDLWHEKLGDARNYLLLLEALVTERDEHLQKQIKTVVEN